MSNIKRVYITRKIPNIAVEMLKEKGYEVVMGTDMSPISQKKVIDILKKEEKKGKGFNALITLLTDKVDKKIIDAGKNIEIVSNIRN